MLTIYLLYPLVAVALLLLISLGSFRKKKNPKRSLLINLSAFGLICAAVLLVPFPVSAAEIEPIAQAAAAPVNGLGLIAAALAFGLGGIGGGIAIAASAPAAIGATAEDPKAFGKSIVFVVLGEAIALYGFVIAYMIISKV